VYDELERMRKWSWHTLR